MVGLKEIIDFQREFDKKHGWDWETDNEKERLDHMTYAVVALCGEVGEFSNLVKKAMREHISTGNLMSDDIKEKLREEIVDVFIYVLKTAVGLDMNLEEEFFEKLKRNEEKFRVYEKR